MKATALSQRKHLIQKMTATFELNLLIWPTNVTSGLNKQTGRSRATSPMTALTGETKMTKMPPTGPENCRLRPLQISAGCGATPSQCRDPQFPAPLTGCRCCRQSGNQPRRWSADGPALSVDARHSSLLLTNLASLLSFPDHLCHAGKPQADFCGRYKPATARSHYRFTYHTVVTITMSFIHLSGKLKLLSDLMY